MGLSATISLSVPALPQNDVWFANSQAWTNYWANIDGTVTITPAATSTYTEVAFVPSLYNAIQLNIDGTLYPPLTGVDMFNALVNRVNVLNDAFIKLRLDLYTGGIISTP